MRIDCDSTCLSKSPSSALLPFFGWEGSPTKIGYRKKGALILTSPLEDVVIKLIVGLLAPFDPGSHQAQAYLGEEWSTCSPST